MLLIATLGPEGSNHEFVAEEYLRSVGINDMRIVLFEDFAAAVEQLKHGRVDCLVQCAAHPDVSRTIGVNLTEIFVVDTFIAKSKPLAVLTRIEVKHPASIGFHPATREYVDLSHWTEHFEEQSTVRVAEGLLTGRYHSGITALEVGKANPGTLRVDTVIGSAQDAWLVYATRSVYSGKVIAWRDGPGAVLLRDMRFTRSKTEGKGK
ncbi:MAG: hypothetical protein ACI9DC_002907 [Gammaproteobacteria bacterium]